MNKGRNKMGLVFLALIKIEEKLINIALEEVPNC